MCMVQLVLPFDPPPIDNNVIKRSSCSNVQYFFGQSKISKSPIVFYGTEVCQIACGKHYYCTHILWEKCNCLFLLRTFIVPTLRLTILVYLLHYWQYLVLYVHSFYNSKNYWFSHYFVKYKEITTNITISKLFNLRISMSVLLFNEIIIVYCVFTFEFEQLAVLVPGDVFYWVSAYI